MHAPPPLSIVIPTYRRGAVLIDTLEYLLAQQPRAAEILLLDQTEQHAVATDRALQGLADRGLIRWLRLEEPSIPKAMNVGLVQSTSPVVLFLDDDIRPEAGLVAAHQAAHAAQAGILVAGRVIQPWEEGLDLSVEKEFRFAGERPQWISEFMGGNFSIGRAAAIALGGFDENFVRVAYKFEAEFAHRVLASGLRIWFEPNACLHHLKVQSGGTRTYGEHLTTWRPDHAVGAYYYSLRCGNYREFLLRPCRAVTTRYHLLHPWRMPATLFAELGGMLWALALFARGPKRLGQATRKGEV